VAHQGAFLPCGELRGYPPRGPGPQVLRLRLAQAGHPLGRPRMGFSQGQKGTETALLVWGQDGREVEAGQGQVEEG
jgi:hypothetical protein